MGEKRERDLRDSRGVEGEEKIGRRRD